MLTLPGQHKAKPGSAALNAAGSARFKHEEQEHTLSDQGAFNVRVCTWGVKAQRGCEAKPGRPQVTPRYHDAFWAVS